MFNCTEPHFQPSGFSKNTSFETLRLAINNRLFIHLSSVTLHRHRVRHLSLEVNLAYMEITQPSLLGIDMNSRQIWECTKQNETRKVFGSPHTDPHRSTGAPQADLRATYDWWIRCRFGAPFSCIALPHPCSVEKNKNLEYRLARE